MLKASTETNFPALKNNYFQKRNLYKHIKNDSSNHLKWISIYSLQTLRGQRIYLTSGVSLLLGYTVNSATVSGDVLYIAGQPRYNHMGQVVIYRMEDGDIKILQTLSGEQVIENYCFNLIHVYSM